MSVSFPDRKKKLLGWLKNKFTSQSASGVNATNTFSPIAVGSEEMKVQIHESEELNTIYLAGDSLAANSHLLWH